MKVGMALVPAPSVLHRRYEILSIGEYRTWIHSETISKPILNLLNSTTYIATNPTPVIRLRLNDYGAL